MGPSIFTENIVLFHLKQKCKEMGLRHFCRTQNLDPAHVSHIINGGKPMVPRVAKAIGYKPVTMYNRITGKEYET